MQIIITWHLYCQALNMSYANWKLQVIAHRQNAWPGILRHVAEAFPTARQGTIKLSSSHQYCYKYLNGAKLRLSDLHNDDSKAQVIAHRPWPALTAVVGLPDAVKRLTTKTNWSVKLKWYVKQSTSLHVHFVHLVPIFYAHPTLSVNLQYLGKFSSSPPPMFGTIWEDLRRSLSTRSVVTFESFKSLLKIYNCIPGCSPRDICSELRLLSNLSCLSYTLVWSQYNAWRWSNKFAYHYY